MFHAAGWTYPWAATFGFATQVPPSQALWPRPHHAHVLGVKDHFEEC